jgi:hypothetical protein
MTMRLAVRRRSVVLEPASSTELHWIFQSFNDPETWRSFGYEGPAMAKAVWSYLERPIVVATIRRAGCESEGPLGFVWIYGPLGDDHGFEFSYRITERSARDGFTALFATDAASHYMFDRVGIELGRFRVEDTNLAAHAVVRRLGYLAAGTVESAGIRLSLFELDRERWIARRNKLEETARARGEPCFEVYERPNARRWRPVPTLGSGR